MPNAHHSRPALSRPSGGNGRQVPAPRRRGRSPVPLPAWLETAHEIYVAELARATLSAETRRTYASKARQFLAWLASAYDGAQRDGTRPDATRLVGDPLADPVARDEAVRAWRGYLLGAARQAPATVNNALAAVDDFYTRRGMGRASAERADLPTRAPRALDERAQLRWLRAVEAQSSPRDRALAGIPF